MISVSLNGSRKVRDIASIKEGKSRTHYSLLDVYAKRPEYNSSEANVPDWFDKLQSVIQTQEPEPESSEEQLVTREESR